MDAKETLEKFFEYLQNDDLAHAYDLVQLTFFDGRTISQIMNYLEAILPFKLVKFSILGERKRLDVNNKVFKTFKVELESEHGLTYHSYPNVVCEKIAYKPSEDGTWGVNPLSAIPKDLYRPKGE
jgi:hypothetical protein